MVGEKKAYDLLPRAALGKPENPNICKTFQSCSPWPPATETTLPACISLQIQHGSQAQLLSSQRSLSSIEQGLQGLSGPALHPQAHAHAHLLVPGRCQACTCCLSGMFLLPMPKKCWFILPVYTAGWPPPHPNLSSLVSSKDLASFTCLSPGRAVPPCLSDSEESHKHSSNSLNFGEFFFYSIVQGPKIQR